MKYNRVRTISSCMSQHEHKDENQRREDEPRGDCLFPHNPLGVIQNLAQLLEYMRLVRVEHVIAYEIWQEGEVFQGGNANSLRGSNVLLAGISMDTVTHRIRHI